MIAAINAGDAETAVAPILGAGQNVTTAYGLDGDQRNVLAGRWSYWAEVESTLELLWCTTSTNGTTTCEISRVSPYDYSSSDPALSTVLLRLDGDRVAFLQAEPQPGPWSARHIAFHDWVFEAHPEAYMPMFVSFLDPRESADMMCQYYPEWLASQDS